MKKLSNLSEQWLIIRDFMLEEKFTAVIKESGVLLETLLKDIILQYCRQLPFSSRSALNELEFELGKGSKGIESFELGPLIQILMARKVNFIKTVSQMLDKDQLMINSINFGYLKRLRNKYSHNIGSAARAEAQYFISTLEILLSFFDIEIFDHKALVDEIDRLRIENRRLIEEKGKVDRIYGAVAFYEKYDSLISNMDYRDTCYYAEDDPFKVSVPNFKELYEKIHYSGSTIRKTRVVLNLANMGIIPWILFYRFVRDVDEIRQGNAQYRAFYCHSKKNEAVYLMHYVLLYNASEIDNGFTMMSLFGGDRERKQRNIIIQNRQIFKFMAEAYSELFNSCQLIDIEELKKIYLKIYEEPKHKDDLAKIIVDYYTDVPNSELDSEKAIALWSSIFGI